MKIVEKILDRFLKHRDIVNCDRDIYLKRWYLLRTPWVGIFIHKFLRSDEDRASNHSHPWNFIVIPIWQGYLEHTEEKKSHNTYTRYFSRRVYPILGIRFRHASYRHRVELINNKSAWSIFIRFKKQKEWGFWPKTGGFIHWKDFWKMNCGED